MGRPRANASDIATEERLLKAAEAAFSQSGFDAARLEDIASSAGVTRASLLYHFGSKEALYAAVVARAFDGLRSALARAIASSLPFASRLDSTVSAYLEFLALHPQLAGVLLREVIGGSGPGRELVRENVAPLIDLVEQFIKEAGKGIVPEDLPVRHAIMMIISSALVATTAGPLREPLWGPFERTIDLAQRLFLGR